MMEDKFKECLWVNFAAAIDMLKNAVALCPDELWWQDKKFFYLSYHTTIFLDFYLTKPVKDFAPALPYTIVDSNGLPTEAVDDVVPNRVYNQQEVLDYLSIIRDKCKTLIIHSSEDQLMERWIDPSEIDLHGLCPSLVTNYTVLEILFYNFRHVQHHAGQLNLLLRQKINKGPEWVSHAH